MATVILFMAVSLDGFIQDCRGNVKSLYPDLGELHDSAMLRDIIRETGAVLMGRRTYEMAQGDFTGYEFQVPLFVLARKTPDLVAKGENDRLSFTFVTEGLESAVKQAALAAGNKLVTVVGGANTAQRLIEAGLLDEILLGIMPVLLGEGLRLFEHLGFDPIHLEKLKVEQSGARTDIRFRVRKEASR